MKRKKEKERRKEKERERKRKKERKETFTYPNMTFGLKHVTQIPTPEQNIQIHSYTIVSKDR